MLRPFRILLVMLATGVITLSILEISEYGQEELKVESGPDNSLFKVLKQENVVKNIIKSDLKQYVTFVEKRGGDAGGKNETIQSKTVVLMWTKYYKASDELLARLLKTGRKWDPDCCTGDDIVVTQDRNLLSEATVVVYFNYYRNLDMNDLPPTRAPGQLWVLFCKESPAHSLYLYQFRNLFNWTMSYRLDSDIWAPYGMTLPLSTPVPANDPIIMPGDIPLSQWISNKSEILTGVISHCTTNSKRERLVNVLNFSLPFDVFGYCSGQNICPRNTKSCDRDKFWNGLATKYRFYLAAENALCVDYITEKFWRTLELGMVPVVYGGANYTLVAPPNSFINVRDFKNPENLAAYLKYLSKNDGEYAKYFEWRRYYRIHLMDGWGGWCTLCKLARQYRNKNIAEMEVSPHKSYDDIGKWWMRKGEDYGQSACTGPPLGLQ